MSLYYKNNAFHILNVFINNHCHISYGVTSDVRKHEVTESVNNNNNKTAITISLIIITSGQSNLT